MTFWESMDSKNHKINEYEILLTVVRALATIPRWPGFEYRSQRHMWVVFVVGSLLYYKRFFCGCSGEKHPGQFQIPFDLEGADTFQPVFKKCSVWVDNYKKYSLNRSYALRLRLNRKIQRELWATKTAPNSKPSLYVRPTKKEIKKRSNLFTSLTVIKRTSLM